jgi:hypothetical protein
MLAFEYDYYINKKSLTLAYLVKVVAPGRIELPTQGFSVLCSTD